MGWYVRVYVCKWVRVKLASAVCNPATLTISHGTVKHLLKRAGSNKDWTLICWEWIKRVKTKANFYNLETILI